MQKIFNLMVRTRKRKKEGSPHSYVLYFPGESSRSWISESKSLSQKLYVKFWGYIQKRSKQVRKQQFYCLKTNHTNSGIILIVDSYLKRKNLLKTNTNLSCKEYYEHKQFVASAFSHRLNDSKLYVSGRFRVSDCPFSWRPKQKTCASLQVFV